jgi:ATP-dependent RNA helicase SUPV3L1/SUV3
MALGDPSVPVAVLGPTNTGKTHLAIERMCGHSSGMIGFPLRLLAREVYDRVVRIKGAGQVALITGEEKILPPNARWFLCTAESMPIGGGMFAGAEAQKAREFAFVGLDEAQLGADPERGHIFTDRLLRARGREETMILGSDTLRPLLRNLVPQAEVIARPRFSTLSYAGSAKLSRLPPRSAIVAFSAEEVYAVAEMLRRLRGGAAVVMGALSPQTRNAQVAMFQAGEVDYLVATDAIGMGLNMDVAHVAFSGLRKFDGRRQRRLTISEMAQIAGRAGRHQRDGTFGTLSLDGGGAMFEEEEIAAIEEHRFPPLDHLYWRESDLRFDSIGTLIADLERKPATPGLRAAPEAIDLIVLKRLADESWVSDRVRGNRMVARLWAACGLPDFRKTGAEHHARLVSTLFRHLSEGDGHIPVPWFADQLARLDSVEGDVETLSDRLAGIRTWAYIAHRADWLAEPASWAARTREIETRLSDALHQRLTQRFVDRRTSVLMRDLGARGIDMLPVTIADDGEVAVDGEPIGKLEGFRFRVDPAARLADKKRLLAAAERRLGNELSRRAKALAADGDEAFTLATDPGRPVAIFWKGDVIARLARGKTILNPRLMLHRTLDPLSMPLRQGIEARLSAWLDTMIGRHFPALVKLAEAARDPQTPASLRALYAPLWQGLGVRPRRPLDKILHGLDKQARAAAYRLGIRIGSLDIFLPGVLKPEPLRWRMALAAAQADAPAAAPPPAGAVTVMKPEDQATAQAWVIAGYRPVDRQMVRADMAERLARLLHDARIKATAAHVPFAPDAAMAISFGLHPDSFTRLLNDLGFRRHGDTWNWRSRVANRVSHHADVPVAPGNAFGALAILRRKGG